MWIYFFLISLLCSHTPWLQLGQNIEAKTKWPPFSRFLNAFSWMKLLEFRLQFYWSLFLRFQLTIQQHWFRSGLGFCRPKPVFPVQNEINWDKPAFPSFSRPKLGKTVQNWEKSWRTIFSNKSDSNADKTPQPTDQRMGYIQPGSRSEKNCAREWSWV